MQRKDFLRGLLRTIAVSFLGKVDSQDLTAYEPEVMLVMFCESQRAARERALTLIFRRNDDEA